MKTKVLVLVLAILLVFSTSTSIYAASIPVDEKDVRIIDLNGKEEIGTKVYSFFQSFFHILETGDISILNDVADDANSYLLLKEMEYKHNFYSTFHEDISDVVITQFLMKEIEYALDRTNVIVYVSASFKFNGTEQTSFGSLYRVSLIGDTIATIDTTTVENQMLKDSVSIRKSKAGLRSETALVDEISIIDGIFTEKTDMLLQEKILADDMKDTVQNTGAEQQQSLDTPMAPLAVSVSYTASDARYYGWWFGDHYENYIFKRASLDCTNFVSQCLWAGYGGTSGYSISDIGYDATSSNSTAVALRQRAAADYRQVSGSSGWYGRNYDSPYGDPVSSFCGVPSLWDWVTVNTGNGPKATGYNNGSLYTKLSTPMKQGDVLQFYNNDTSTWYHSVFVVSTTDYNVSNYTNVRVAQHDSEHYSRPLDELIQYFGGSNCKMRLLRFGSTTFSS
jgi:hypothetical protein